MSGTSIVSEWHFVSFRILLSVCPTAFFHVLCNDKYPHVRPRSRDLWMIAKGMLCPQWVAQTEPIWTEANCTEANGQMEGSSSLDDYTMGRRSPCCIYCVTSLSECEGSCLGA